MTILYRAVDAAGQCLYVGITDNLPIRWRDHWYVAQYWSRKAHHLVLATYPTRAEARRAERETWAAERPLYGQRP